MSPCFHVPGLSLYPRSLPAHFPEQGTSVPAEPDVVSKTPQSVLQAPCSVKHASPCDPRTEKMGCAPSIFCHTLSGVESVERGGSIGVRSEVDMAYHLPRSWVSAEHGELGHYQGCPHVCRHQFSAKFDGDCSGLCICTGRDGDCGSDESVVVSTTSDK